MSLEMVDFVHKSAILCTIIPFSQFQYSLLHVTIERIQHESVLSINDFNHQHETIPLPLGFA
jgi:hypothetical protein